MVLTWSSHWKASKKPRKQRNYMNNAPLHILSRFMHIHLSKDLRKKIGIRQLLVCKGDKIRIQAGVFKKKEGKVIAVNLKKGKIYVEGIERIKKDGSKVRIPLEPSNCMLLALEKEEKRIKRKKAEHKGESP